MPLYTQNKFSSSQLKTLGVVMAMTLWLPLAAHAAGFGKLTVLSSLGQPLRAEIALTSVSKEEAASLAVKLAPVAAFREANIDFNPILSSLRVTVEQRRGTPLVRITSSQAIREPFVDLLLELRNDSTHLVREYTFLLDPPDMRKPQMAQSAPARSSSQSVVATKAADASATVSAEAVQDEEESVSSIVMKPAPSPLAEELIRKGRDELPLANVEPSTPIAAELASAVVLATPPAHKAGSEQESRSTKPDRSTNTYRVKNGDTLGVIASKNKAKNISLDQMLVALYRANPDAFINENINLLRAGRVLSIPDAETVAAISQTEAKDIVVVHAHDFNLYRNKLAKQVASGAARKADGPGRSARGKITTKVEEKSSAASETADKLQLSRAGKTDSKASVAEEGIAADKAMADANERVAALEKNISDLEKLLEMQNKGMAELSDQQKPSTSANPEGASTAPAGATDSQSVQNKPVDAKLKPAIASEAQTRVGFFDDIMANPFFLPGMGAIVALLVAWGIVRVRNRKKAVEEALIGQDEEEEAASPVEEEEAEQVGAAQAPAEVVKAPVSEDVAPVQAPEEVAEMPVAEKEAVEAVDPIVEADTYITYGQEQLAEDVLLQALQSRPERQDIRVKLLEMYARREDVQSFNNIAKALHDATDAQGEAWEQAVVMGKKLNPTNVLYGGVGTAESAVARSGEEHAEAGLEFDLSDFKAAEVQPGTAQPAVDIGSKIDFDLELGSEASQKSSGVEAVASDIMLDLPTPTAPPVQEVDDFASEDTEMATKLELAAAYQEIGDKDGARELLEEVVNSGDDNQVAQAKAMLSKLE